MLGKTFGVIFVFIFFCFPMAQEGTQGSFNFDTTSTQLTIPFTQSASENQEDLEQAKKDARNTNLSERERLDAKAAVEVLKQTPVTFNS